MADRYPKSIDELTSENVALRDEVSRLQASVSSLQSSVVARDAEIAQLRRPKAPPRVLDKAATDSFKRPAYSR